jgi:hypothetical protein
VLLVALALWLTTLSQVVADELPIFDAHVHYNRDAWGLYSADEALSILDRAGVYRAFVSSTPDDGTRMLYERAPNRIVPAVRPYRTPSDVINWTRDPSIASYVEAELAAMPAPVAGIGELHLFSGEVGLGVPTALAGIATSRDIVLQVHSDAVAVRQLLDAHPNVKVLWAHAGMSESPATVQRILDSYANVWVELALRYDVAPRGQLDPAWAALFERYPDRFMIGTDTWVPSQWTRLPELMADVRTWLRQLRPELAAAIASGNAERVLAPSR